VSATSLVHPVTLSLIYLSAHQLGNSIAVLRQYYELGVRYVTLTHTCHNAFADSCGFLTPSAPRHYGLSPLGFKLVAEMNRIGMLVDLSHTSDMTATQALLHSKAPVIWSHSSARAIHDVSRNVPDEVLSLVGFGEGQRDAVVMVCLGIRTWLFSNPHLYRSISMAHLSLPMGMRML